MCFNRFQFILCIIQWWAVLSLLTAWTAFVMLAAIIVASLETFIMACAWKRWKKWLIIKTGKGGYYESFVFSYPLETFIGPSASKRYLILLNGRGRYYEFFVSFVQFTYKLH